MSKIYHSVTELVGKTPLVELDRFEKINELKNQDAHILAKVEYFNPIGSAKDRIVLKILQNAEKAGKINKDTTVVEVTSGNTGIAAAAFCAVRGYKARFYIQDWVSVERKKAIKAFGAELRAIGDIPEVQKVLDETNNDFFAATAALKNHLRSEKNLFFIDQAVNPFNAAAHYESTGKELWDDTDGKIDILVASVGTGGTLSGCGKYLKEKNPDIKIVAVQPTVTDQTIIGVHNFTDVPEDRIPANLDRSLVDEIFTVLPSQAFWGARLAAKKEGLLVGTSSGAALYAASQVAKRRENKGKNIAVILVDTGLRYLSTELFEA